MKAKAEISIQKEQKELSEFLNKCQTEDEKMLAQSLIDLLSFYGPTEYYFEAKKEVISNLED